MHHRRRISTSRRPCCCGQVRPLLFYQVSPSDPGGSYGTSALLSTDEKTRNRIDDSVSMLKDHLKSGHLVYGSYSHALTLE
jgi:hypothetical protein